MIQKKDFSEIKKWLKAGCGGSGLKSQHCGEAEAGWWIRDQTGLRYSETCLQKKLTGLFPQFPKRET
jgi:hypothetical protein